MSLPAFYTALEERWSGLGLSLVQRRPIVPGNPAHGWRWEFSNGKDKSFWVSLNASVMKPWDPDDRAPWYSLDKKRAATNAIETLELAEQQMREYLA
jgi:hypothetical protein